MPRRRLLPFALVAAGFVAVVTVLGLTGADGGWMASLVRTTPDEPTPEEMTAGALVANPTARGPQLLASETAKPRETHGPVTLNVVDRAGALVEGARVVGIVYSLPEDGLRLPERLEQVLTDGSGRARFHDLPYDARARVSVRARAPGDAVAIIDWLSEDAQRAKGALEQVLDLRLNEPVTKEPTPPTSHAQSVPPTVVAISPATHGDEFWRVFYGAASSGLVLAEVEVTGPAMTLTIDRGLPLEVQVREGGEGRLRADARWQVRPRLAWADDAYGAATLPLARGKPAQVTCRVEAPKGFIAQKAETWNVFVHPQAQRLVAVYPLRPAVDVLVLLPPEVMPYRVEDWEGSVTVAGVTIEAPNLHVDAHGRLRVRGGAHVVGDLVHVSGSIARRSQVNGVGYIGPDPRQPVLVDVAVTPYVPTQPSTDDGGFVWDIAWVDPAPAGEVKRLIVNVLPEGVGYTRGSWSLSTQDSAEQMAALRLLQTELAAAVAAEEASKASLPVRAVAWNGGPAAGAVLRLGDQELVADAQGRAIFRDVPTGTASILMLGAGAHTSVDLEVGPAPRPEAVLTARAGGTLDVEVVDTQGRPLPYARVELTFPGASEYMNCVDGVQRLDLYTDEVGRRACRAVPAGAVKVYAAFGTRSGEREIALSDGGREVVRIELPVHGPPPPPEPAAPAAK